MTKLVSLPFRENFAKRNSVKNPSFNPTTMLCCYSTPMKLFGKSEVSRLPAAEGRVVASLTGYLRGECTANHQH